MATIAEVNPEQEQEYVNNMGELCPVCESDELEWGSLGHNGPDRVTQKVSCLQCGASWFDVYELVGFTTLRIQE